MRIKSVSLYPSQAIGIAFNTAHKSQKPLLLSNFIQL